jgi:hypothetical protein
MKKIPVLIAVACYCIPVFSQTLAEGYVVKTSGDTLRGFIRDRVEWFQPYIDFATAQSSGSERIPLSSINVFYLKKYDTYYYGRILEIDKKPVATSQLENAPGRAMVQDTIALRLLVKGTVNFYDYTDENFKQHFFVQKNNGNIEELAYVRYMARNGQIAEMSYFVEPLKNLLGGCDNVNKNGIRYDQKALIRVIRQYNSCFEKTEQYEVKREHAKVGLGVFGGVGVSQLGFKGNSSNSLSIDPASADFSSTTSVFAGIRVQLTSSRDAVRLIPALEIMYQKTGTSKATTSYTQAQDDFTMNFTFVNSGLSIKYLVVKKQDVNAYLKVGVNGVGVINATSTYTKTDFLLQRTTAPADFATYKTWGFAYSGGAGVSYKRLWLELNYGKNLAPAKSRSANGLCTSLYATVGVRITKN